VNILALTSSYPLFEGDATAPFIKSITRHVAARGHTVHLVLPEHRAWNHPEAEDGVHFHPYRYSPRRTWTPWGYSEALEGGETIRRRLYLVAPVVLASALRTCRAIASRERIDVVHAHWLVPNGLIGSFVARWHGLPLVVSLHGSDVAVAERSRALGALARSTLGRSSAVTGPSFDLLDRARALGASDRFEWIPYGADPDQFRLDVRARDQVRARLDMRSDDVVVLGIGRFVPSKGFDDLVEAVAAARTTSASRIRLLFVGDGPLRSELESQVERLGLDNVTTFAGMAMRIDVPPLFAASDVVAVPSVHHHGYVDGLPNVALEAMANSKPLVVTRVGGLPDIVTDGFSGLVVEERDPRALASAISTLAADPELRRELGRRGRALVEERLNWATVAERLEEIFESVVRGKTREA
jgi:glycosyltransferase involved in cell wall biosynthesis